MVRPLNFDFFFIRVYYEKVGHMLKPLCPSFVLIHQPGVQIGKMKTVVKHLITSVGPQPLKYGMQAGRLLTRLTCKYADDINKRSRHGNGHAFDLRLLAV